MCTFLIETSTLKTTRILIDFLFINENIKTANRPKLTCIVQGFRILQISLKYFLFKKKKKKKMSGFIASATTTLTVPETLTVNISVSMCLDKY